MLEVERVDSQVEVETETWLGMLSMLVGLVVEEPPRESRK